MKIHGVRRRGAYDAARRSRAGLPHTRHLRASLTRKDKYPRLAIYSNSRCARLSRPGPPIYADCSRLLFEPLSFLLSLSLHRLSCTASAAHFISHATSLFPSLFLFLSFTLFLLISSLPAPVDRPRDDASSQERAVCGAAGAITYLRRGLSKPPGRHPRRCTVNQAVRLSNIRPTTWRRSLVASSRPTAPRRTASAGRPVGVNAEMHVHARCIELAPGDLTRSTFVLTSGRLPGRLSVRGARFRAGRAREPPFYRRLIRATGR